MPSNIILDDCKKISQKTRIKAVSVASDYSVVFQENYLNEQKQSAIEYVVETKNCKNVDWIRDNINDKAIDSSNAPVLYRKELLDVLKATPPYEIDFSSFEIEKPFTYYKENGINEEVILLFVDKNDFIVKDINGNIFPTAIFFETGTNNLTSEYYNIRQVVYLLKQRDDIYFKYANEETKSVYVSVSNFSDSGEKVTYEAICPFVWMPKRSDFKKYIDFCEGLASIDGYKQEFADKRKYILNNILNLNSAKKFQ